MEHKARRILLVDGVIVLESDQALTVENAERLKAQLLVLLKFLRF